MVQVHFQRPPQSSGVPFWFLPLGGQLGGAATWGVTSDLLRLLSSGTSAVFPTLLLSLLFPGCSAGCHTFTPNLASCRRLLSQTISLLLRQPKSSASFRHSHQLTMVSSFSYLCSLGNPSPNGFSTGQESLPCSKLSPCCLAVHDVPSVAPGLLADLPAP